MSLQSHQFQSDTAKDHFSRRLIKQQKIAYFSQTRTSVRQILAIHDITSTFTGVSHLRQLFTPIRLFKGRIKILWLSIIINKMSKYLGMFSCLPQRHPSSIMNPPNPGPGFFMHGSGARSVICPGSDFQWSRSMMNEGCRLFFSFRHPKITVLEKIDIGSNNPRQIWSYLCFISFYFRIRAD